MSHSFIKLAEIRDTYKKYFTSKGRNPSDAAIAKAINEDCVGALSVVRNLIVHKSARTDSDYERDHRSFEAVLPTPQMNKPFPVDGGIVHDLLSPVMGIGIELIRHVDSWIQKETAIWKKINQKKSRP